MNNEIKKDLTSNWFKLLQNAICDDINKLEKNKTKFKTTTWQRNKNKDEGGGEYRIIKDGKIFEKVGVNFSKVYGKFPKKFQKKIPGATKDPRFWASGISVVMHMQNPHIPAMHFNTRYICTTQNWFGGGMDVTPSIKDVNEKKLSRLNGPVGINIGAKTPTEIAISIVSQIIKFQLRKLLKLSIGMIPGTIGTVTLCCSALCKKRK